MCCQVTVGGKAESYTARGIGGPIDDLLWPINHGILYYPGVGSVYVSSQATNSLVFMHQVPGHCPRRIVPIRNGVRVTSS